MFGWYMSIVFLRSKHDGLAVGVITLKYLGNDLIRSSGPFFFSILEIFGIGVRALHAVPVFY